MDHDEESGCRHGIISPHCDICERVAAVARADGARLGASQLRTERDQLRAELAATRETVEAAHVILPKPIRRWEFLLGKYVGIVVTAAVFIAIMGAIQLWVTAIQAGASLGQLVALPLVSAAALGATLWKATDRTAVLVPWSLLFLAASAAVLAGTDVPVAPILSALLLVFGGAFSLGIWVVGRNADLMAAMRDAAVGRTLAVFLRGLSRVVPNLHLFVPGRNALADRAALPYGLLDYVGTTMLYGSAYAVLLLILASLIFRRFVEWAKGRCVDDEASLITIVAALTMRLH